MVKVKSDFSEIKQSIMQLREEVTLKSKILLSFGALLSFSFIFAYFVLIMLVWILKMGSKIENLNNSMVNEALESSRKKKEADESQ